MMKYIMMLVVAVGMMVPMQSAEAARVRVRVGRNRANVQRVVVRRNRNNVQQVIVDNGVQRVVVRQNVRRNHNNVVDVRVGR